MGQSGIEEDALCGGGLTGIHVRDNADITIATDRRCARHDDLSK
jgi:hypothetical protein